MERTQKKNTCSLKPPRYTDSTVRFLCYWKATAQTCSKATRQCLGQNQALLRAQETKGRNQGLVRSKIFNRRTRSLHSKLCVGFATMHPDMATDKKVRILSELSAAGSIPTTGVDDTPLRQLRSLGSACGPSLQNSTWSNPAQTAGALSGGCPDAAGASSNFFSYDN